MKFFSGQWDLLLVFFVTWLLQGVVFWTGYVPADIFWYLTFLEGLLWLGFVLSGWNRDRLRARKWPIVPRTAPESALQSRLKQLKTACRQEKAAMARELEEKENLYALWAHQNKLPIVTLDLLLQQDPVNVRLCRSQLVRMEQYTQMVLAVSRMESRETDYVFEQFGLDSVLHQVIHTFAPDMISRGLRLEVSPVNLQVLSDRKWLHFVLCQILSNASKYASSRIWISVSGTGLSIRDDGPGISLQDQARLFHRGVTGKNGRDQIQATGLGLYLSKRILDGLGHSIRIDSGPGKGCTVQIDFSRPSVETE